MCLLVFNRQLLKNTIINFATMNNKLSDHVSNDALAATVGDTDLSKPPPNKVPSPNNKDASGQKRPRGARPKPVFFWTNLDVLKWLKRHMAELFPHYCHLFEQHDITGRSLVRMTDVSLERLGISDYNHRDEIWREILKLKLKCDILELRDMQNKGGNLTPN